MTTKRFLQIGERVEGKISKNESFELNAFVDKMVAGLDEDLINSLESYGKVNNLKLAIKNYLNTIIDEDIAGREK